MSHSAPKLRSDLQCRVQTRDGITTHVIKDPANGQFYRLQAAEGFIAEQLDGENTLDAVQRRVETKFGAAPSLDELAGFVKQLDRGGLLDNERSALAAKQAAPRFAGNLFYLRMRLIDPDRMLDTLLPRVRWLFSRAFVYLSATTILAGIAIGVLNAGVLATDLAALVQLSTLPMLIVTIFVTISLHELGHALTCKHYGGQVREMGFLLLYFQPAMYCNVSDAWLFTEKYKRLWVGFAGPYFELFIWGLSLLIWRITDLDTWVNQVSLVVMATSGVKTLFNFNPLIKLDGYYLLSDYLDIPNLRKKSFRYLGNALKRLSGRAQDNRNLSARERRIYLYYGVTAWLFSVSLLSYIGLMVGEYLIVEGQRVAFLGLTSLLTFRFRDKYANLFGRRRKRPRKSSSSSPRTAEPMWRKIPLIKLTLGSAILALIFLVDIELRVAGPIDVRPHHNADVRTEIDGIVDRILVDEGQHVSKGDVVAVLSGREHKSNLLKVEAEIRQLKAQLSELVAGPTRAEIDVARSSVVTAEGRLRFAAAKRQRNEELFQRQLVSAEDFDVAREQETTAQNELAEAKGRLNVLLEGTRPEQIEAAQAELGRLKAERQYLQGQLERLEVLSPADGMVTTPSRQLHELLRQSVAKGALIAKVHALDIITVETSISEKEIADVQVGQRVDVKTRAYPDRVFQGEVIAIGTTTQNAPAFTSSSEAATRSASGSGSAAASNETATTIRITTEIDNSHGLLLPGMTGMAKVYCGQRRIADLILRRLSRTFRVEFWSWW